MSPIDEQMLDSALCLDNDRLDLTLFATEQCNFRCTYCWETPGHGEMPPEVVAGIERLIESRAPGLRLLNISWFGGEPMLARNVVRRVMRHVRGLEQDHPSMVVSANMTTNAWFLDREALRELVALGVPQFQVTIDGPPRWHDRRRLLAGGGGTFHRIWGNLCSLGSVPEDFRVEIRLHVDRENMDDLPGFLERCKEDLGGDDRFLIFLYPLSRLGGGRDNELRTLSCEQDRPVFDGLKQIARSHGFEASSATDNTSICHTANAGSWLIRADGRVGKCPVGLDHPANQLGRIHPDGTMTIDNDLFLPWIRGVASGDTDELGCPLRGIPGPPAEREEAVRRSADFLERLELRLKTLTENEG